LLSCSRGCKMKQWATEAAAYRSCSGVKYRQFVSFV
jgi:hypothetical protein